jgi:hypothetical protein
MLLLLPTVATGVGTLTAMVAENTAAAAVQRVVVARAADVAIGVAKSALNTAIRNEGKKIVK